MTIDTAILTNEEKISFALRSLYNRRGYAPYRMSKFEEYELYMKNKDFLRSPQVIAFTDTNGKLMALKPDVTLSIVRAWRPVPGAVQKLYYDENVYRVSESAGAFREIRQTGVECLGAGDDISLEVVGLALESLALISPENRLCVSLLGVVEAMLDALAIRGDARREVLRCMGEKNVHELRAVLDHAGVTPQDAERLARLTLCTAAPQDAVGELAAIGCPEASLDEAARFAGGLPPESRGRVSLDFSILGDMRYYNDLAFQGYVLGVPSSVLSGGVYDRLLGRMGKPGRAIGFACYLDKLERLEVSAHA